MHYHLEGILKLDNDFQEMSLWSCCKGIYYSNGWYNDFLRL